MLKLLAVVAGVATVLQFEEHSKCDSSANNPLPHVNGGSSGENAKLRDINRKFFHRVG